MDAAGRFRNNVDAATGPVGLEAGLPVEQRPIAPGKVRRPLPPWDAAFPGVFLRAETRDGRRSFPP